MGSQEHECSAVTKGRVLRALFPKDRRFKVAYNLMVVARGAHRELICPPQERYFSTAYENFAEYYSSHSRNGFAADQIVSEAMDGKTLLWSQAILLALFLREAVLSGDIDAN